MNSSYKAMERITGQCNPARNNTLTGANQHDQHDTSWAPYRSAEPDTILFDEEGYAHKIDEPISRAVPTDWPAGVMKVNVFQ